MNEKLSGWKLSIHLTQQIFLKVLNQSMIYNKNKPTGSLLVSNFHSRKISFSKRENLSIFHVERKFHCVEKCSSEESKFSHKNS